MEVRDRCFWEIQDLRVEDVAEGYDLVALFLGGKGFAEEDTALGGQPPHSGAQQERHDHAARPEQLGGECQGITITGQLVILGLPDSPLHGFLP